MGVREPPRDQGRGEPRTADGDGGGEPEHLQVRAVVYLPGLEGSLGCERQLQTPKLEGRRRAGGCQATGRGPRSF